MLAQERPALAAGRCARPVWAMIRGGQWGAAWEAGKRPQGRVVRPRGVKWLLFGGVRLRVVACTQTDRELFGGGVKFPAC